MDHKQITVSAIATTFNCCEELKAAIHSLADELDSNQFVEIVVVDGGSTDGTWQMLMELAAENDAIRIYQEPGANISRGRNLAVGYARGNVLLSFDSGCSMVSGYVALMTHPFLSMPDCDVVGAKTVPIGTTEFEKAGAYLQLGTRKDEQNPSSRGIAFRRTVFDAVGGYDESVLAGEDTHFNWKWRNHGFKYIHVPEAKVFWRVRSSLGDLYRMQRRNATGSVALRNPWNMGSWAARLNILSLLIGLLALGLVMAGVKRGWWFAACGIIGWLVYILFRTIRRGRFRFFCHPIRFAYAVLIMLATDLGTWAGTLQGWRKRRSAGDA